MINVNQDFKRLLDFIATDELLTRQEVADQIFHKAPDTVDKILLKRGFPYLMVGSRKMYSRKAVVKWIADNIQYQK